MLGVHLNNSDGLTTSSARTSRVSGAASEMLRTISVGTDSIIVEPADACRSNDSVIKYATIVDIDISKTDPLESYTFQRPSIDELTKKLGPSRIMDAAKPHDAQVRWIHLRANCMGWIEDLMNKICEERGMAVEEMSHTQSGVQKSVRNPFLRLDLWNKLYHGQEAKQIHTRFMRPMCTQFAIDMNDEESDSNHSTRRNRDNLVLYLPYLHWESCAAWEERQELLEAVTEERRALLEAVTEERQELLEAVTDERPGSPPDERPGSPHADGDFVKEYLHHRSPLHDRRSLTQAYYYDLAYIEKLGHEAQVMERYTAKDPSGAKMIVVDQLWLWVIKGRTNGDSKPIEPDIVITAFPERFDGAPDPSANVYERIVAHLQRGLEPPLKSANDLAALIVEHCTGVFFQRELDKGLWFFEFFACAIGSVRKRQILAFHRFCKTLKELTDLESMRASADAISEKLDELFSINNETSLTAEITTIIDELNCIDFLSGQQQDVLSNLTRAQRSQKFSNRSLQQVCEMVKERRDAWANIERTARRMYGDLRHQIDLKQKQANISEARSSRRQAEASARHGRIILLFTVVTIIFLPMSFLTSWFGMNAKGINSGGNIPVGTVAAIIFPISITITLFALVLAFSERMRNLIVEIAQRIIDFVFGATGVSRSRRRRRRERMSEQEQQMLQMRNFEQDEALR